MGYDGKGVVRLQDPQLRRARAHRRLPFRAPSDPATHTMRRGPKHRPRALFPFLCLLSGHAGERTMRRERAVLGVPRVGTQPTRPSVHGGNRLSYPPIKCKPHLGRIEESELYAPILLSTSSSRCPSFRETCVSNALLRYDSGSRASRISITTSALSRTAARCGNSGFMRGGTRLVSSSMVEAAFVLFLDLDGRVFFARPSNIATPESS